MRKLSLFVLMASLAFAPLPAFGAFKGPGAPGPAPAPGGFVGPISGAQAETVARALELPNDAPVVLTGNLTSQVATKKDKFMFRDASGEIMVDIEKKAFRGQTITPQNTIRIVGTVEKDFGKEVQIEVKQLDVLD